MNASACDKCLTTRNDDTINDHPRGKVRFGFRARTGASTGTVDGIRIQTCWRSVVVQRWQTSSILSNVGEIVRRERSTDRRVRTKVYYGELTMFSFHNNQFSLREGGGLDC